VLIWLFLLYLPGFSSLLCAEGGAGRQDVLFTLLAGMAATLIMSLFTHLIHGSGLANAGMIRARGSMITRKFENALAPGIAVHLIGGGLNLTSGY
jgi:hypothetical protein